MAELKPINVQVEEKIKALPLKERVKAIAIYHYTQKKFGLDDELEKTMKILQKEYDLKALPIYDQQSLLILGERQATEDELKDLNNYFTEAEKDQRDEFKYNKDPFDNFWGQALTNCEEITLRAYPEGGKNEKDAEVLKYLKRISVEIAPDTDNFTLRFLFDQNEFFTNAELTKKFYFSEKKPCQGHHDHHDHQDHHHDEDVDFPNKSEGTEIQWNEGKNVTKKTVEKKQKNKKTGASRMVKKQVDAESFFNFFRSINLAEKDKLNEEEIDDIEQKMEEEYEISRTIVDELIPYSLEYYLGINPENDDYEDEEDCDDDEDGDDKDSDEDGDEEKDKKDKKKSQGKKAEKKPEKTDEKPPECKPQ